MRYLAMPLTQEQINTLRSISGKPLDDRYQGRFFSIVPEEIILRIANFGQEANLLNDNDFPANDREEALRICRDIEAGKFPNATSIEVALHHAAFARQRDIDIVLRMVKENPPLMFKTGHVLTPSGLFVKNVTLYEFFLGAGDPEAAKLVRDCFFESIPAYNEKFPSYALNIEEAQEALAAQYERYRPHIEGIFTQEAYDLRPLIEIIKEASREDILALLNEPLMLRNHNGTFKSALHEAMDTFRHDWGLQILDKPRMHYNYNSLKHAFEIFVNKWDSLYQADGWDIDKLCLISLQIIGFEQLSLPGSDRCAIAQGLRHILNASELFRRSDIFRHTGDCFPQRLSHDSSLYLGLKFWVDLDYGALLTSPDQCVSPHDLLSTLIAFCEAKTLALQALQPSQAQATERLMV
jgi:hypothetical protein